MKLAPEDLADHGYELLDELDHQEFADKFIVLKSLLALPDMLKRTLALPRPESYSNLSG